MEMTPRERWLAVLKHEKPDRIPLNFSGTPELMEQLIISFGLSSQEELFRKLHIDNPISVGPTYCGPNLDKDSDMYGCKYTEVDYGTGKYRECVYHPLAEYQTVDEIEAGYTWPKLEWFDFSGIADQIPPDNTHPVQTGLSGAYTLYTWLRGNEQAMIDFAIYQDLVQYCMEQIYNLNYEMAVRTFTEARGRIDIGSIANDMGSQIDLLFSLDTIRNLFLPGIERLASLVHANHAHVFFHSDGAIRKAIPDLIEVGVDILDPVQWRCKGMDRAELKREYGDRLVFHGGVDNQYTLFLGTIEEIKEEVIYNIKTLGAGGGYILAPYHALQAVSSPESVLVMYETAYENGVL